MKSKVISFYDYKNVKIPEEVRNWHIRDEEIEKRLETLCRNHPEESHPDTAARGDSVLCQMNGRIVPIYPGQGMFFREDEIVGMKKGETKGDITVLEITRRRPAALSDAVILAERIENVKTVAEYSAYFREKEERERRINALKRTASYIGQEVLKKSEFRMDEEETDRLSVEFGRKMYEAMVKAGIDPTVPEDGVDFLTEEEALARMVEENRARIPQLVLDEYYATEIHPITEEMYQEKYEELKNALKKNDEELLEYAGEIMIRDYIYGSVFSDDLYTYVEQELEDK